MTERVIRRSAVPVLTVPSRLVNEPQRSIRLETVFCAVDFSEPSARAVGYGASIAAAARARLLLAHALEWSEEMETPSSTRDRSLPSSEEDAIVRMNELLTEEMRMRCTPELIVSYGRPADEILRVIHERHVDLLVLGIRGRNLIDRVLFGSTAQRVIREHVCPVLTVPSLERT